MATQKQQPDGQLDVGETWELHRDQHTVTQAEIDNNGGGDAESIDNTATADSAARPVRILPMQRSTITRSPALNITKVVRERH